MAETRFATLTEGRAHFTALMDASASGRPATVKRGDWTAAIVDADRLRHALAGLMPANAELLAEAGGWTVFLPGYPLAADGDSVDDALDEMVIAMREYAEDWSSRLRLAPNHADNWGLVQLIALSDDQQLKDWLIGQ